MYLKSLLLTVWVLATSQAHSFPTFCSVVNAPQFESCLGLSITGDVCGYPPRPCARITYWVPEYFLEVVSHRGDSFFTDHPIASLQLGGKLPYGSESDGGSYSFHAHALPVPLRRELLKVASCGGELEDLGCFNAMTEDVGSSWSTGQADLGQPKFLAWSASPKACLLKGAASSVLGSHVPLGAGFKAGCSFNQSYWKHFPPSNLAVCNGWGINFPRTASVTSSDQTTASLVVATRLKSLGAEVFQTLPSYIFEKWQMINPNASACFLEGQNIASLRTFGVFDVGRSLLKPRNYLYAIWRKTSCRKDLFYVPLVKANFAALKTICKGEL